MPIGSHVHLVAGDGTNGFAEGVNGITVDQGYERLEEFPGPSKDSSDRTATARVDVMNPNDKINVMIAVGHNAKKRCMRTSQLRLALESFKKMMVLEATLSSRLGEGSWPLFGWQLHG